MVFNSVLIMLIILYIVFTAFGMSITGQHEFLNSFKNNNFLNYPTFKILFIAIVLSFLARLAFILINYHLYKNTFYQDNAASIAAALTSLSYVGIYFCNLYFLNEPFHINIMLGFIFITIGCFLCLL